MKDDSLALLVQELITKELQQNSTMRIPVSLSNRHIHLSEKDFQKLFGPEASLEHQNPLSQPGQFAAKQTIFGVIAREMRKYYVSLLVVDQRPSGIDDEVLSQIGTKIVALLNDEKDIQAILTGVSNSSGLRTILSTLDTKKQALVFGYAVPMPVVIRTREYDDIFYAAVGGFIGVQDIKKTIDQIF